MILFSVQLNTKLGMPIIFSHRNIFNRCSFFTNLHLCPHPSKDKDEIADYGQKIWTATCHKIPKIEIV